MGARMYPPELLVEIARLHAVIDFQQLELDRMRQERREVEEDAMAYILENVDTVETSH